MNPLAFLPIPAVLPVSRPGLPSAGARPLPRLVPHPSPARRPSYTPRATATTSPAATNGAPSHTDATSDALPISDVKVYRKPGTIEYVKEMRRRLKAFCLLHEEPKQPSPASNGQTDDWKQRDELISDPLWLAMQDEARDCAEEEPLLASFLFVTIINHRTLASALAFHLANKLSTSSIPSTTVMELVNEAIKTDPTFCQSMREDLLAVMERDPACTRFIDAFLYFKGFHALQAYRVAHTLWNQKRYPMASYLQSQVSKELQVDIHPAARIGPGAFIDHATGVVIGETCVIGKNVSMLHHVTLGGSGSKHGDRHPKVGDGVLIGAGATILGNIKIGSWAQIGACSLVLEDVEERTTVVGVPARVVGRPGVAVPAISMIQDVPAPTLTPPPDTGIVTVKEEI